MDNVGFAWLVGLTADEVDLLDDAFDIWLGSLTSSPGLTTTST